jgi:hypothetical protein
MPTVGSWCPPNMHPGVICTLVLSLHLVTISALPTNTPPTEPEVTPQHLFSDEGSYICCPDAVEPNSNVVPLGCKLCTANDPVSLSAVQFTPSSTHPLPLPNEGGQIEGGEVERGEAKRGEIEEAEVDAVFSFAGRATNGLANWKLNWKEQSVELLTGVEQLQQIQMERMQALFEMEERGGAGVIMEKERRC